MRLKIQHRCRMSVVLNPGDSSSSKELPKLDGRQRSGSGLLFGEGRKAKSARECSREMPQVQSNVALENGPARGISESGIASTAVAGCQRDLPFHREAGSGP